MPKHRMTTRQQTHGFIRSRAEGFTLVELMIVLVIVAVVGAIALPRFAQATARQQLDAAAGRVAADLELARTRARAASQSLAVSYSTANDHYSMNAVGGDAKTVELDESPYGVDLIKVKFGTGASVTFNGYGVPSSSGAVVLESNGNTVTVTLDANGEVRR